MEIEIKCVSMYTNITRDVLSIKPCNIRVYVRLIEREGVSGKLRESQQLLQVFYCVFFL